MRKTVVFSMLGATLDVGQSEKRWHKWRPNVALFQQADFLVDRLELLYQRKHTSLMTRVVEDIALIAPESEIRTHELRLEDPWNFEEVYSVLADFADNYSFVPEEEDYLVHITTGSHVTQICEFLLTEARWFPARLLQTASVKNVLQRTVIDLQLREYDEIARRFAARAEEDTSFLKGGIITRNANFNRLMERIEQVSLRSDAPILLTGPTGAGKTQLARRIYELKKRRHHVDKRFVEVNCATLRGDQAMSTLFGHRRGAFTGASADRDGLLKAADGGLLFLDEIGELGLDEQAMLLTALETGKFLPLGADREVDSKFLLVAGTNKDLTEAVARGEFREDLFARINLWTFRLPALVDRREDIVPNIAYELDRWTARTGQRVSFNAEAQSRFERFATYEATWPGNFRDLSAAITRMATLAPRGRIDRATVDEEIEVQRLAEVRRDATPQAQVVIDLIGPDAYAELDLFDRMQLAAVVATCRECATLSDAGRKLFAVSRAKKANPNDADRIRKYLQRFGVEWSDIHP